MITAHTGFMNPVRNKILEYITRYEDNYHVVNNLVLGAYWIKAVKAEIVPNVDDLTFTLWGIPVVIDRSNDYTCSVGYVASAKEDLDN